MSFYSKSREASVLNLGKWTRMYRSILSVVLWSLKAWLQLAVFPRSMLWTEPKRDHEKAQSYA